MALTAIAATAVAAEIDFLPYTETICAILGTLIFDTEPNMFAIRGRALECLGHIAVAIGTEKEGGERGVSVGCKAGFGLRLRCQKGGGKLPWTCSGGGGRS